jgi:hypothetical protein
VRRVGSWSPAATPAVDDMARCDSKTLLSAQITVLTIGPLIFEWLRGHCVHG